MAGAGMSAGGSGGAGGKVDLNVKVNVMNMQDISKIGSRVDRQVKHMSNSFKGMGKQIGNVNVQVSAMDKSVNALGNQMGFVAFQWMFFTGIATSALQQIKDFAVTTVREGAKGTDAIVRAVIQTGEESDIMDGTVVDNAAPNSNEYVGAENTLFLFIEDIFPVCDTHNEPLVALI